MGKLLEINDLKVRFHTPEGVVQAVDGVNIDMDEGETLAIVGESGCGKTVTTRSIMQLIPMPPGEIHSGSIKFCGKNVLDFSLKELQDFRGKEVAMIFQEPMTSLNPVLTIADQLVEAILSHEKISKKEAFERAVKVLELTGIPSARERSSSYPHQMSGGMKQRVMIAMALSCNPKLLIADEPTTALDVTIQAQILKVMSDLKEQFHMGILLITHDLSVVAEMAERVAVMYSGRVVEIRKVDDLFNDPQHPYTQGLLNSMPLMDKDVEKLNVIQGSVPNLLDLPKGCNFEDRCEFATERCKQEKPELLEIKPGVFCACFNYADMRKEDTKVEVETVENYLADKKERTKPLVMVKNLEKKFYSKSRKLFAPKDVIHAVNDVSFNIYPGETFGLVGESGSGKTTIGRIMVGLESISSGDIIINDRSIKSYKSGEEKSLKRNVQIMFQDPYSSLNPRMKVEELVGEGLRIHEKGLSKKERDDKILHAILNVGLKDYHMPRFPHEFSGGQRQRIGIARSLILDPGFIVCDEPVSALDVSIQAQILNLLKELQSEYNLTYLFIAHNLSVVKHISDRIGVLYLGRFSEIANKHELYKNPLHPYTQALLSAIPKPVPGGPKDRILLEGDIPSPINPPSGCHFRTRCRFAKKICSEIVPPLREVAPEHFVSCHLV